MSQLKKLALLLLFLAILGLLNTLSILYLSLKTTNLRHQVENLQWQIKIQKANETNFDWSNTA